MSNPPNRPTPPVYDGPSKSQRKRDAHDAQSLGAALLKLPQATLDGLNLSERLRSALTELRRLEHSNARARQLQFVGKLMRDEDAEPLRRVLEEHATLQVRQVRALKDIERWRTRLMEEPGALEDLVREHPAADAPAFRAQVEAAQREHRHAQAVAERTHAPPVRGPLHQALFKALRDVLLA